MEEKVYVNTGDILNPNKNAPFVFGRINLLKMFTYGKVVDIGCFDGKMFSDKATNVDIWDLDDFRAYWEQTKNDTLERKEDIERIKDLVVPNFVKADATKGLPFKDKEYNCAVLSEILEHMEEPEKLLKEAMRVADCVIITVPNEWEWDKTKSVPFNRSTPELAQHKNYFTQEKLYELFGEVGLQVICFMKLNLGPFSHFIVMGTEKQDFIPIGYREKIGQFPWSQPPIVGPCFDEIIAMYPTDGETRMTL